MKENKLFKEIEEDAILRDLSEALKVASENAQSIPKKLEQREAQLLSKLNKQQDYIDSIYSYDIDEIEKAVERNESRGSIVSKIIAIRKLKNKTWTNEEGYRKAMLQYLTYITPILTDLETAKQECRKKIAEIKAEYNEAIKEFNLYENKAIELLGVAGEGGMYMYHMSYENSFNRIARSDYYAAKSAERYKDPIVINQEITPKITKHQSLDGIQDILNTRQIK